MVPDGRVSVQCRGREVQYSISLAIGRLETSDGMCDELPLARVHCCCLVDMHAIVTAQYD